MIINKFGNEIESTICRQEEHSTNIRQGGKKYYMKILHEKCVKLPKIFSITIFILGRLKIGTIEENNASFFSPVLVKDY